MKEGSKVFLHNFDYWYISFRYISAPESMRGHALAGGDFLGVWFLLGGWGMVFLRAPAQRLFAYAQYDTPSPRGAPRLGRKDMGKMPAQQALKVVWRCVFCGRPLRVSLYIRLTPASVERISYAPTTNSPLKEEVRPPQRLFAYAHSDGGKALRSKCGRIKISHPITKSEFFC